MAILAGYPSCLVMRRINDIRLDQRGELQQEQASQDNSQHLADLTLLTSSKGCLCPQVVIGWNFCIHAFG